MRMTASGGLRTAAVLLGLVAAMLTISVASSTVRAETRIGVSPSLLELRASPGDHGLEEVAVYNEGDEPFSATVSLGELPGAKDRFSAKDWVVVRPEELYLRPGEHKSVELHISVPRDASSGGHYVMLYFRTGVKRSDVSGTGVSGRVGVPLLFTVKGREPIERGGSIERVVPFLGDDGTVSFGVLFRNTGNIHLYTRGEVRLEHAGGGKIRRFELPKSPPILPDTTSMLRTQDSIRLSPRENYVAEARVKYSGHYDTARIHFTPEAKVGLKDLRVTENEGAPPTLSLKLVNEGDMAVSPFVSLGVFELSGKKLGGTVPSRPITLLPGQTTEVKTSYPGRLGPGRYIFSASVAYGKDHVARDQTSFRLLGSAERARPDAPAPPKGVEGPDWARIFCVVAVVLAVLILVVCYLPPLGPLRRRLRRAWQAFRE